MVIAYSPLQSERNVFPQSHSEPLTLDFIDPNEQVVEIAKSIGVHLCWHGPLMIEFATHRSAKPVIIEMNTRPWLLNESFRQAGLDFITGTKNAALTANIHRRSAIWIRGLCELVKHGISQKCLIEEIELMSQSREVFDSDLCADDMAPFNQISAFYSKQMACQTFYNRVVKIL